MEIPSKLKLYAYHNLIAFDQLFNALTGGAADETLSSRTYRKDSYESELKGRQHDKRFSQMRKGA